MSDPRPAITAAIEYEYGTYFSEAFPGPDDKCCGWIKTEGFKQGRAGVYNPPIPDLRLTLGLPDERVTRLRHRLPPTSGRTNHFRRYHPNGTLGPYTVTCRERS